MAGSVIYLDVDDEITSAAARIRGAETGRVAVVLPYGSRVATSRINFRLLARDAQTNGKRLSIVASDAATRALAASAGLPIFGSVAEYESSLEGAGGADPEPVSPAAESASRAEPALPPAASSSAVGTPPSVGPAAAPGAVGAGAADADAGPIDGPLVSDTVAMPSRGRRRDAGEPASEETAHLAGLAGAAARHPARTPAGIPAARVVADTPDGPVPVRDRPSPASRARPATRSWRDSIGRTPLLVGLAVLGLALVVSGVGAFLLLPTATAAITPRTETIGPISLRIRADPSATAPDAQNAVVPARRIAIPLEASDAFPATGKRIQETRASGRVTFLSNNPVSANEIPKGSIVSTEGGIRFRTVRTITIPPAELIFGDEVVVKPSSESVDVTAVDPGTEGNVPANAITVVPRNEDPNLTQVVNGKATSGGKHDEFPRVTQSDVDEAVTELTTRLTTDFEDQLLDPALPGDTGTVFPQTKTLAEPEFAVDPNTFVGQEVETFELSATSEGSVVAVDTEPVQVVAEARIESSVKAGFELIEGSGLVNDAPAEIIDGVITFPVVITARQVLVLDPEAIKAEIMGKPLADARAILATYGEADLQVWPDWVGTIPTLDSRVEVATSGPVEGEPSATPGASGARTPRPSATPARSPEASP